MPISIRSLSNQILSRMYLIRYFEERVIELCHTKELEGLVHVGIGQEGVATGIALSLKDCDYLYGTHRSHGHFLAGGTDPKLLMAELAGKDTGLCRGRGGSMHIVDIPNRLMTATGIVGGTISLALGTAIAKRDEGAVVAVYFGDGASNTGSFHECLNMASLWKLPVIMVCENNGYAEFTPMSAHTVVENISDHGKPYGIPATIINGNDVLAVLNAANDAVKRAREGDGPTLIECLTYRLRGHYVGDPEGYRGAQEVSEWREKDPIRVFSKFATSKKFIREEVMLEIRSSAQRAVDEATEFMRASPWPDGTRVADFVYGPSS
ncbi:MAG: thiamine pyrophosphate-dependent dehydrogenase E1 component subunit alpha [Rhodospirillaceae bacterium]